MKQLIGIVGGIALGIFIFGILASDQPGSLKDASKQKMNEKVQMYKVIP